MSQQSGIDRSLSRLADNTNPPQAPPTIDLEMSEPTLEEGQKISARESNFNQLVSNDGENNEENKPKMWDKNQKLFCCKQNNFSVDFKLNFKPSQCGLSEGERESLAKVI